MSDGLKNSAIPVLKEIAEGYLNKNETTQEINGFDAVILRDFVPETRKFTIEEVVAAWGGWENGVRNPDANWKYRFLVHLTGKNPMAKGN